MRTSLGARPCPHMQLDFAPLFTKLFQSFQEPKVLLLRPTALSLRSVACFLLTFLLFLFNYEKYYKYTYQYSIR